MQFLKAYLLLSLPTTLEQWEDSVKTALSYGIDHLSAYALIIEDGTKLSAKIKPKLTFSNPALLS